jgi:hypothetical protein
LKVESPGVVRLRGPVQSSTRTGPLVADDPIARRAAAATKRNGVPPRALRRAYEAGVRTFTWNAADPDGDRLRFRLEIRAAGDESWFTIAEDVRDTFFSWDARSLVDGDYRVRLTADDSPDNARGSELRAERTSHLFPVDNTRPSVGEPEIAGGPAGWTIRFEARDPGGAVTAAELSLDAGAWEPFLPLDGVADSEIERFELEIPATATGEGRAVRVRVVDGAGNLGGAMWSVPAP